MQTLLFDAKLHKINQIQKRLYLN